MDKSWLAEKRSSISMPKEHKTKKVKAEKNPNMLDTNDVQDFENNGNRMAVIAWKSLSNEDKIHHLEKTAKRKAKYEKLQKDMEIQRDGRGQRNNSAAALVVV
ncbi:hypothetical protein QL285_026642 [Trifolium repens]|nr:hypothetical protein QL285_026642 [Trifolium repens]